MLNEIRKITSTDIPSQFPAHYRESGDVFVEFVEAYYQFLEEQITNSREMFVIRDIDSTYENFLSHFKKKYLNDLPPRTEVDTRFIVKHIQDLYRKKGTKESLQLFFKLFFNEEIEVFYPATSILKISDSVFGSDSYVEMESVNTTDNYYFQRGDKLTGSSTKSQAYVDDVIFKVYNGSITPIIFLSNTIGEFTLDDRLIVENRTIEIGEYVPKIRGSIKSVTIDRFSRRMPDNKVGERVKLVSSNSGTGASGIISRVSSTPVGSVEASIDFDGWGYTRKELLYQATMQSVSAVGDATIIINSSVVPSVEHKIKFDNDKTYYSIQAVTFGGGSNLYQLTISPRLNAVHPITEPIYCYRANTVNDVSISNQIAILSPNQTVNPAKAGDPIVYDANYDLAESDNLGPYYVEGTNTINSIYGYYYPLYTDASKAGVSPSVYNFTEYPGVDFFMPAADEPYNDVNVLPDYYYSVARFLEYDNNIIYFETNTYDAWPLNSVANQIDTVKYATLNGQKIRLDRIIDRNASADFEVAEDDLSDVEVVSLVTDIIADYLTVPINSSNYGMSGPGIETKTTQFKDAFIREEFILGGINSLLIRDNGFDYVNRVYTNIVQPTIERFNFRTYAIEFEGSVPFLLKDDLITQEYHLFNQDPLVDDPYVAKARYITRLGNVYYFKAISFYQIQADLPVNVKVTENDPGTQLTIASLERDPNTGPMGANSIISLDTSESVGQIEAIKVSETGFKYRPFETVDVYKEYKTEVGVADIVKGNKYEILIAGTTDFTLLGSPASLAEVEFIASKDGTDISFDANSRVYLLEENYVARASIELSGTGFTEGAWNTTTSFLNESNRVIRDNDYYQEYSYEISSPISPEKYEDIVKDTISVVGTKMFSSPLINTINQFNGNVDIEVSTVTISVENMTDESGNNMITETGEHIIVVGESNETIIL